MSMIGRVLLLLTIFGSTVGKSSRLRRPEDKNDIQERKNETESFSRNVRSLQQDDIPRLPPPPRYRVRPVRDGAVIARIQYDTNSPCVIRIPDWVPRDKRAHASAEFYLYYSSHTTQYISMSWATTPLGPWTPYHVNGGPFWVHNKWRRTRGVMDFAADVDRLDWDHVGFPDLDIVNETFVLYFHGRNGPRVVRPTDQVVLAKTHHETFVATSQWGLNFNAPSAGGDEGYGPRTVTFQNITRDLCITELYARHFYRPGNNDDSSRGPYAISKRGILSRPFDFSNPFAPLSSRLKKRQERQAARRAARQAARQAARKAARRGNRTLPPSDATQTPQGAAAAAAAAHTPFGCLWWQQDQSTTPPPAYWQRSDARDIQPQFVSALATFLASTEFAHHPHNPHPGMRLSSSDQSTDNPWNLNHVAVSPLQDGTARLEVFFWIKQRYRDLYRLILDVRSDDWSEWNVARHPQTGLVYLDVLLTPQQASRMVRRALKKEARQQQLSPQFNSTTHAVAIRNLGDPFVWTQGKRKKILYLSYASKEPVSQPPRPDAVGQGQITSFRLLVRR